MEQNKYFLSENEMPTSWYNIAVDLTVPIPPLLNPLTKEPATPDFLSALFPMEVIMQAVSKERYIPIPEELQEIYRVWRPTPLVRARRLEKALDTPAKIYYKNESVSPPGSHKPNTAVAQAFYAKKEGVRRISTETGAGQWGSALSMACNMFDIECKVFMVKVSYEQKPYRRSMMQVWGADVTASPSEETDFGRSILAEDPDSPGSLGMAISEAVEVALKDENTKYSLGSVVDFVLIHQTIVGEESLRQLEMAGDYPDVVIGCVGGGSNYSGFAFPFLHYNLTEGKKTRFVAVEPTACPTMTKGPYAYDYGDTAGMAPIAKMHTLGHTFVPPRIHSGGLRYHGMAPLVSLLCDNGFIEAVAYHQNTCFEAAMLFARTEGIIPAPETAHAIRATIDEALRCKEAGKSETIVFNFSGHGHFDLAGYDAYLAGKLTDYEYPREKIEKALQDLPEIPG